MIKNIPEILVPFIKVTMANRGDTFENYLEGPFMDVDESIET